MGQGDVLPFRRKLLPVNVHGFYVQNCACLIYADVDGAEQSRKLPALSSCSKRMNEQISIKRQVVSSMVPLK